jgi:hypothetical protein
MKSQRINNIAALKTSNGEWIRDDASKAELLAENFVKKNVMLPPQLNCFSDVPCRGRRMRCVDMPTVGAARYVLLFFFDR